MQNNKSKLFLIVISISLFACGTFFLFNKNTQLIAFVNQQLLILPPKIEEKKVDLTVYIGSGTVTVLDGENFLSEDKPDFVKIENSKLLIENLKKENIGNYYFEILADKKINYQVSLEILPSEIDFVFLEQKIKELVTKPGDLAFALYDTKRKKSILINEELDKPPASVSKLIYAVLILKDIDAGNFNLTDTYPIVNKYKEYSSDYLYSKDEGTLFSIQTYLEFLLKESDNTAMSHLEAILGGYEIVNDRVKNELKVENLKRRPHESNASSVLRLLQGIYSQEYLKPETNGLLIEMMIDTSPRLHNRIKAGIVDFPEAVVAHKIGNLYYEGEAVVNDAGIVYGKYTDFLIVFLHDGYGNETEGNELIRDITKLVYQTLN